MTIPDEAVEALARVIANESLFNADMDGYGWDSEKDSSDHFMPSARTRAQHYLESAAPQLMAQAWEAGFDRGFYDPLAGTDHDASESAAVNPY